MTDISTRDIQHYHYTIRRAAENGFKVDLDGNSFTLTRISDDVSIGKFLSVLAMFNFLCGYETGYDKGLSIGRIESSK